MVGEGSRIYELLPKWVVDLDENMEIILILIPHHKKKPVPYNLQILWTSDGLPKSSFGLTRKNAPISFGSQRKACACEPFESPLINLRELSASGFELTCPST